MKKSKLIFIIVAILFFIGVIIIGIDIARKTSFPGSEKHLPKEIINQQ